MKIKISKEKAMELAHEAIKVCKYLFCNSESSDKINKSITEPFTVEKLQNITESLELISSYALRASTYEDKKAFELYKYSLNLIGNLKTIISTMKVNNIKETKDFDFSDKELEKFVDQWDCVNKL